MAKKWKEPVETRFGPGWIIGQLAGEPIFSDGHAMFLGKRKGSLVKPENGFDVVLDRLLPHGKKALPAKAYGEIQSDDVLKVKRGDIILQLLYARYAEEHFKGVKFFASKEKDGVICKVGEKVVGAIMGCRLVSVRPRAGDSASGKGERPMSEQIAEMIDRLENLNGALQLPLRAEMHVDQLKKALPEVIAKLKEAYVYEFNDNPWE
jgi:hypothetical protein